MANDRRISKSKRELKEALLVLMEQKDFKRISITDIVTCADLNRGTFYKHYQSKEELLHELIDDVMENLIQSYREPYLHSKTFVVSELTTSKIKIFEHVASHAKFYAIIVNSNVLPGFQNKICDVLKQLAQRDLKVVENINRKIDLELYCSYNAYALFGLIVEWVKGGFRYTPHHMAEQLIEFLSYNQNQAVIHPSHGSESMDMTY